MKTAIIDLSYGDTGKGRVSAFFCKDCEWSVRFNGGNNAGHTVYDADGNVHKFHHLPAGAAFGKKVALDTGMVIDFGELEKEVKELRRPLELYVSNNVHLITPQHKKQDENGSGVGSTKRGIAYVYADRAARKGVRMGSYFNNDSYKNNWLINNTTTTFYNGLPPIGENESAIYEGAQGIMLDVDYGCYPYVTSSSVMPSMAHKIDKVIGVMKAYVTRVGDGPPNWPDVEILRELGQEYGATTGRPRKCTWLDMRDLEYAISIVQPDEIVVTKLDILQHAKPKVYDMNGDLCEFGSLDSYENWLLETYPEIKWFSKSPKGDMIKAR